jgi:hypothetical protein
MYWNAAYYHELPSETQRLKLAEPLNTIPMIEDIPTWIGGIISGAAVL